MEKPDLDPQQYLDYLSERWNPQLAVDDLGCKLSDIVHLQRDETFVKRFWQATVGSHGPMAYRTESIESVAHLLTRDKVDFYLELKKIASDPETDVNAKVRILQKFFDKAMDMEGVSQKVQHTHEVTHKLDPESAKQLADAQRESASLLEAPLEIEGEVLE